MVKPTLDGMKIRKELKGAQLNPKDFIQDAIKSKDALDKSTVSLQECEAILVKEREYMEQYKKEKTDEQQTSQSTESDLQNRVNELNVDLENERQGYQDLAKNYDTLVSSSAYTICCKERVDDPAINSYAVSGDRIDCGVDKEVPLDCV